MHNPFQKIKRIQARPFTSLPAKFRKKRRTTSSDPTRRGAQVDSFLEGPSFDRDGNLWCVDIPFGRIFRIDPKGEWELAAQYDGWPNGLKIHRDGRIFIADYRRGLLVLYPKSRKIELPREAARLSGDCGGGPLARDAKSGKIEPRLETAFSEGSKGLNALPFADNGDLYFTDQ